LEVKLFGSTFNPFSLLEQVPETRLVTFLNPVSFYGFKEMAERGEFDTVFSDGALLTRLHNLFFPQHHIQRISFDFSSIAEPVIHYAEEHAQHMVFVGGSSEDVSRASAVFKQRFPRLSFEIYSGFFESLEARDFFIDSLNHKAPHIIVCGMGFPHQEQFLIRCKKVLNQPFVGFTCGGFISQTAMRPDYYSAWVKRLGLRWLQRACMHHHVRQRLLKDYPIFLVKYLWDVLKNGEKVYQ
jgi:UDP-Gal:alpha-D-GlcNAc-diphosphoundecaprenol beta-1,4-galactosyltransferase